MRRLISVLKQITAEDNYKGQHEAPVNDGHSAPLYDLTENEVYPEDIYSINGLKYYGAGEVYDNEAYSIIRSKFKKPRGQVKIYRAVPDHAKEYRVELDNLNRIMSYYNTYKFFKMGEKVVDDLSDEYSHIKNYDDHQKAIIEHIDDRQNFLVKKIKAEGRGKINVGDWVSITKKYAADHGRHHLNNKFKIVSKTVPAKHVWTDGNSIHEWGYDPR